MPIEQLDGVVDAKPQDLQGVEDADADAALHTMVRLAEALGDATGVGAGGVQPVSTSRVAPATRARARQEGEFMVAAQRPEDQL